MSAKEILEKALQLKPEERFTLIEGLIRSLDEPNKEIDEIWIEEAEKRLKAYREGRLEGISMDKLSRTWYTF
jgi:putative addiction module component (TIGR02574 family)